MLDLWDEDAGNPLVVPAEFSHPGKRGIRRGELGGVPGDRREDDAAEFELIQLPSCCRGKRDDRGIHVPSRDMGHHFLWWVKIAKATAGPSTRSPAANSLGMTAAT